MPAGEGKGAAMKAGACMLRPRHPSPRGWAKEARAFGPNNQMVQCNYGHDA